MRVRRTEERGPTGIVMTSRPTDEAHRAAWPAAGVAAWLDWQSAMGVSDTLEDAPRCLYGAIEVQAPVAGHAGERAPDGQADGPNRLGSAGADPGGISAGVGAAL